MNIKERLGDMQYGGQGPGHVRNAMIKPGHAAARSTSMPAGIPHQVITRRPKKEL